MVHTQRLHLMGKLYVNHLTFDRNNASSWPVVCERMPAGTDVRRRKLALKIAISLLPAAEKPFGLAKWFLSFWGVWGLAGAGTALVASCGPTAARQSHGASPGKGSPAAWAVPAQAALSTYK